MTDTTDEESTAPVADETEGGNIADDDGTDDDETADAAPVEDAGSATIDGIPADAQ